ACITGEVGSVLDLAVRQRPRVKHPKGVSRKAKGVPLALEIPAFQGHPAQRALAAPAQERPILLTARLGVLFAHSVDRARVQGEFLAASCRQPIQIEAARPALVPFQRLLLSVVAEIPDEVAGARLAVEQSSQRFDAVSIDQQHWRKVMRLRGLDKTLKLSKSSTFTVPLFKNSKSSARCIGRASYGPPVFSSPPAKYRHRYIANTERNRKPQAQERYFLSGSSAGAPVPEK